MPTIDLTQPAPAPSGLLDQLPRRVTLTLPELQLVAAHAGDAPLPFATRPASDNPLEGRLGDSPGTTEASAYQAALAALHPPEDTLRRRGLLTDDGMDAGLTGAVGLLATPRLALDLDLAVGTGPVRAQVKAWHRHSRDAVATLATTDGVVFELAWFGIDQWAAELARVAVVPEDLALRASVVPETVDLPYDLADAAGEAIRSGRADVLPVLSGNAGPALDAAGEPMAGADVDVLLGALAHEAQGRLRALVADVTTTERTVVGVVSWLLLADGWHALRPHVAADGPRLEVRRVEAADLAAALAPVLVEVSA
ncbi:hypothetical protein [Nocardioides pacificus]